jgi:hypothetical protein
MNGVEMLIYRASRRLPINYRILLKTPLVPPGFPAP